MPHEHHGISTSPATQLLNSLSRLTIMKTPKLCITCLCEGNPPVTGGFTGRSPHEEPTVPKKFPCQAKPTVNQYTYFWNVFDLLFVMNRAHDIFKCIFLIKYSCVTVIHWNVFPSVHLAISHHWYRQWMACHLISVPIPGMILDLCPANERHRYKVTPSLIGWAQT